MVSPLVINFFYGFNAGSKLKELYLSPHCEELFGKELTEALLRDFGERNPDLSLRLLNTAVEREADIFIFDEGEFSGLASSGALMPFEPFPDSETDGQQLAVPLVSFMDLLFYNIDILKAAGFDRPPKTRDEFLAFAQTVAGSDSPALSGVFGTAMGLSLHDRQALSRDIFSWIWAAGGDFWSAENGPVINTRAMVSDISFLGRLYREGALAPESFDTAGNQRLEEFSQGKIAMIIASSGAIPFLRDKMGDGAFGVTTIPVPASAGKYSAGLSSLYAGINASCAYPAEARNFLVFLAEQSPLLCAELKAVPGDISQLFPGDYVKDDPFYSKAQDIFEASKIAQGFSGKAGAQEYEKAFIEEIRAFFGNTQTAQETANAIQQRWNAVRQE